MGCHRSFEYPESCRPFHAQLKAALTKGHDPGGYRGCNPPPSTTQLPSKRSHPFSRTGSCSSDEAGVGTCGGGEKPAGRSLTSEMVVVVVAAVVEEKKGVGKVVVVAVVAERTETTARRIVVAAMAAAAGVVAERRR